MNIIWDITNKCNLRCKHCYNIKELEMKNKELETMECCEIINKFPKGSHIHFLGGEPLIRKDFLKLAEYISKKNSTYSFVTNGTLLYENLANKLINTNITDIIVSLDGYDSKQHNYIRGDYVFEKLIRNIGNISKLIIKNDKQIKIKINVVLNDGNIDNIERYFELAESLNIKYLFFTKIDCEGNAKINNLNIDTLKWINACINISQLNMKYKLGISMNVKPKVRKYLNCRFNEQNPPIGGLCSLILKEKRLYIRYDGYIYPCNRWYSRNDDLEFNIKDTTIKEVEHYIDTHVLKEEFINFHNNKKNIINEVCSRCEYKNLCNFCVANKNYLSNEFYSECIAIDGFIDEYKKELKEKQFIFNSDEFVIEDDDSILKLKSTKKNIKYNLNNESKNAFLKLIKNNNIDLNENDIDYAYTFKSLNLIK